MSDEDPPKRRWTGKPKTGTGGERQMFTRVKNKKLDESSRNWMKRHLNEIERSLSPQAPPAVAARDVFAHYRNAPSLEARAGPRVARPPRARPKGRSN